MNEVDPWVIIEKLREQHKAEIHDVWMPLVAQHRENCERLQSRLEDLEQEMQEQCRINGMSAERELRMAAKMEKLTKENASLKVDALRWREVLTNDTLVVCTCELDEIFKSKLEHLVDSLMKAGKEENAQN